MRQKSISEERSREKVLWPTADGSDSPDALRDAFRRVICSGTMGWHRQLIRPAHEVAVGIWMAGLDPATVERPQTRQNAPVATPKPKPAPLPTPAQTKRPATLDALPAEGLVTQAEYDAKRIEIWEDR